jgi:sn-glycerol 3-phosphate transport system substrate-binding protein
MNRRTLLAGAAALAASTAAPARAQAGRTRIVFWHAMTGVLNDEVNRICAEFNAVQTAAEIVPVFKGTYPETLTAAIAAWRANQAPHLVQMFEVGTGSMLAAGPAVKQTWQLIQETGVAIDPAAYIGAVRGYYSLPDGRLASMPFNSSTAVMWINKDAFDKANLDTVHPPRTWAEVVIAAKVLKDKAAAPVAMTTAWFAWIQLEQYAAMHDLPFSTRANGFEGLDTELQVNAPPFVKHLTRLMDMQRDGSFRYAGRDDVPNTQFFSGEAAISFMSSGNRGDVIKNSRFKWLEAPLPYDQDLIPTPLNSVIGGASLWTMTAPGRTAEEYKGVAEFLRFIAQPKADATWHQRTGYVPVTTAGYEDSKREGFYDKNPGADVPIVQLARGTVTPNSKGFRLGRMPEIRNIVYEEVEGAFQGKQDAKAALDSIVSRGNRVLREFERANKA